MNAPEQRALVGFRRGEEFVRGLFRSDYVKEEEDLRACRASLPTGERPKIETPLDAPSTAPAAQTPTDDMPATPATPGDDDRRGFWARIKSKFSKS